MQFEFNKNKSDTNKEKHGIDFVETQKLWSDTKKIIIPAKSLGESRFLLIGKIEERYWSAIFTLRNQKIRIISVRRSRQNEKKIYNN